LKLAQELGSGAEFTYRYEWESGSKHEFNEIDIYANNTGHIERVKEGPSSNQAFDVFGKLLRAQEAGLIKSFLNKITEPPASEHENAFDQQVRERVGGVAASALTQCLRH
jgi:hypothetical protein